MQLTLRAVSWVLIYKMSEAGIQSATFAPNTRPAAYLGDPALYPFHVDVETRFQDLDLLGHVNNVAMAAMFEEARFAFGTVADFSAHLEAESRIMVASVQIHFLSEAFHGTPIRFFLGAGYIGTASWRLRALGQQQGRNVMMGDASVVHSNRNGTAELPTGLRQALKAKRLIASEV